MLLQTGRGTQEGSEGEEDNEDNDDGDDGDSSDMLDSAGEDLEDEVCFVSGMGCSYCE